MRIREISPIRLVRGARSALRDRTLRRLAGEFRRSKAFDGALIHAVRKAWGNESWSANETYLLVAATLANNSTGQILECGSGLSTFLLGLIAEKRGTSLVSLEQDGNWAELVSRRLSDSGITRARVIHAPLRRFRDYVWYETTQEQLGSIDQVGLAVVDGPSVLETWGEPYHQSWRYGVIPQLTSLGIRFDSVLLDDASEPRGANLLRRWREEFQLDVEMTHGKNGDLAICRSPLATSD